MARNRLNHPSRPSESAIRVGLSRSAVFRGRKPADRPGPARARARRLAPGSRRRATTRIRRGNAASESVIRVAPGDPAAPAPGAPPPARRAGLAGFTGFYGSWKAAGPARGGRLAGRKSEYPRNPGQARK